MSGSLKFDGVKDRCDVTEPLTVPEMKGEFVSMAKRAETEVSTGVSRHPKEAADSQQLSNAPL